MPNISQIHVDKVLSELSIQWKNDAYVADAIFPKLAVKKHSDKYFVFDRDFKLPNTTRAIGAAAHEAEFGMSNATYQLAKQALKTYIADDEVDNYDMGTLKADATEYLTDKILMRKEVAASALLNATGTWSLQLSLAVAWSTNSTTSDPFPTFNTACSSLVSYGGRKPNFAMIPYKSYLALKTHVSVLDRIKYTSAEFTVEMLKGLMDIPEIHIPSAVYDSATDLTESMAFIMDTFAFIGYKTARPSPRSLSFAYNFEKLSPTVKTWRDEERESEAIEVNSAFSLRVVCSLCGYLVKGTNA